MIVCMVSSGTCGFVSRMIYDSADSLNLSVFFFSSILVCRASSFEPRAYHHSFLYNAQELENYRVNTFMSQDKNISVAFVCLGNICRSPMAEAVFRHTVKNKGLENKFDKIDSFGTSGWHTGETPDRRSISTCRLHGVQIDHRAKQIKSGHFHEFDYILCMDDMNLRDLRRLQPKGSKAKLELFGNWNRSDGKYEKIVDDPYYGGVDGFEHNFLQVTHFSESFLIHEL